MRLLSTLALVVMLVAPGARGAELLVHAAASLGDALAEAAVQHEARTGVPVRIATGGSNTLARQILRGAPGDVFFSADEMLMDHVQAAGLVVHGTRRSLLTGSLVVVVPWKTGASLRSSADLALPSIGRIALADPESVPAGIYAREHFMRIGAWESIRGKVVPMENVRAALAAVASGNADAAVVYATDALRAEGVRTAVAIPRETAPEISYPVAVLASSEHPDLARAFVAFLASEDGLKIFARRGFGLRR